MKFGEEMIKIDLGSEVPIYLQLRNQIVLAIARGELQCGDPLPTVRQLAEDMGVNPMTVSKTYNELKNEGYLESNIRQGTLIRKTIGRSAKAEEKLLERLELLLAEAVLMGYGDEEISSVVDEVLGQFAVNAKS